MPAMESVWTRRTIDAYLGTDPEESSLKAYIRELGSEK
jgi:hypothetical protein